MRYNDPNRPTRTEALQPVERKSNGDTGDIHADGYKVLSRRPRSKFMMDSVPVDEAKQWEE